MFLLIIFISCFIGFILSSVYLIIETIELNQLLTYIPFDAMLIPFHKYLMKSIDPILNISCQITDEQFFYNTTYKLLYNPKTHYDCLTEYSWNFCISEYHFTIFVIIIMMSCSFFILCSIGFYQAFYNKSNNNNNFDLKYNLMV